jgi:hypothetical protein
MTRVSRLERALAGKEKTAGLEKLIGRTMGKVTAAPFGAAKRGVMSALMGRKNLGGKLAGTRMKGMKGSVGTKAWDPITPEMYRKYKSGALKGEVVAGRVGGKKVYFRRKTRPGGVVGLAMKHPKRTAATGALAYLLASSPVARGIASGYVPNAPKSGMTDETKMRFGSQVSTANPLARSAWG